MLNSFIIPFITVIAAELFDKSQLTVLLLGAKTRKHTLLLIGVTLAFIIVDGSAVLLGAGLIELLPFNLLKIISGILFILFGVLSFKAEKKLKLKEANLKNPLLSGFLLVFVSEMGDKTQIASAIFATRFKPVIVFTAVISALFILSLIALKLGSLLRKKVNKHTISVVSGLVFIILGVLFLLN